MVKSSTRFESVEAKTGLPLGSPVADTHDAELGLARFELATGSAPGSLLKSGILLAGYAAKLGISARCCPTLLSEFNHN